MPTGEKLDFDFNQKTRTATLKSKMTRLSKARYAFTSRVVFYANLIVQNYQNIRNKSAPSIGSFIQKEPMFFLNKAKILKNVELYWFQLTILSILVILYPYQPAINRVKRDEKTMR